MRRRSGVPLIFLILLGLGLSGAALILLGAFFSWLSLGTPYPWDLDPRPSQEAQFGIVRNAVTAGAALGLGVTLLLSYRRQKTNEQSQDIAARALQVSATAQETAAEALQLANKQHALDVDRRHDDAIRELHSRYARGAEQLAHAEVAVRLAGVYATAALADDWGVHGKDDQRQACVDLLCSYYRIPAKDPDRDDRDSEVRAAVWATITARSHIECSRHRSWSDLRHDLQKLSHAPGVLYDLLLNEDGRLDFYASKFTVGLLINGGEIAGGTLNLQDIESNGDVSIHMLDVTNGAIYASYAKQSDAKEFAFEGCHFAGGRITIGQGVTRVLFIKCSFSGTDLTFSSPGDLETVEFVDSPITVNPMRREPFRRFTDAQRDRVKVIGLDSSHTTN